MTPVHHPKTKTLVLDVAASVERCERVLGFKPEYTAGTPMEFAICSPR